MQSQLLDFSGNIGPEHISEFEKHNKFDQSLVEDHYDSVAINYEQAYLRAGYPDPKKV